MATRQNLIDTYNANPTLQARYTLPQYLALFDFSYTTTTPTPTTTTTPTQTPATPGIPNIINQNLNQGGDGGDGGPQGIAQDQVNSRDEKHIQVQTIKEQVQDFLKRIKDLDFSNRTECT